MAREKDQYGFVSITFGAEDTGGWYDYASVSVANRREMEDLLKKLESVLKKAVDEGLEAGKTRYGPLKSPRDYLDELAGGERERQRREERQMQEWREAERRKREENRRICPLCGKETTVRQLSRSNCCRRCEAKNSA